MLAAGALAAQFTFGSPLVLLVAIVVAFGSLDAAVLTRIHRLETGPLATDRDLRSARAQVERLARVVLIAGSVLGGAALLVFALIVLSG